MKKKNWDVVFEKELMPFADALKTFAYHLTYDETDAEDLVQDTLLKAYRSIERYETGTNAKAWLFKILKNGFINDYRRRVKQPSTVNYDEIIESQDDEDASPSTSLVDMKTRLVRILEADSPADAFPLTSHNDLNTELFANSLGDEVTRALDDLAEEFRTVILLADVEDFTYEEIAKILDIPIGTVRSRLFRARNLMKEKLKAYAESFGYEDKRAQ
jgi:RNA polymerase sigma factor (sigma-70 family)